MDKLNLAIIEGTTRKERKSIYVAKFIYQVSQQYPELKPILVDPVDFNFPNDGNDPQSQDPKYTKIVHQSDAFLIVVPEYNFSFPGSLKRMLDSELKNYIHKPVAFAGVSAGPWGGVRAIEALVPTVREMGLVATFVDIQFPKVQNTFNETGQLIDQSYTKRVKRTLDELIWMAKILKYGRENEPNQYHQT